jgi:hypothetical protein
VNGRAILLWQKRSMHTFACFFLPKEDCPVIRKPHICFPSINTSCSSCHSNSIDSTFILHDMHRNWICQGKEKGYASTIPVHVPFSSAHQLMASWSQFPLTIRLPLKTKGMIVSSLHVQVGLFR